MKCQHFFEAKESASNKCENEALQLPRARYLQAVRGDTKSRAGGTGIINVMGRIRKLRVHTQANRNAFLFGDLRILLQLSY